MDIHNFLKMKKDLEQFCVLGLFMEKSNNELNGGAISLLFILIIILF